MGPKGGSKMPIQNFTGYYDLLLWYETEMVQVYNTWTSMGLLPLALQQMVSAYFIDAVVGYTHMQVRQRPDFHRRKVGDFYHANYKLVKRVINRPQPVPTPAALQRILFPRVVV